MLAAGADDAWQGRLRRLTEKNNYEGQLCGDRLRAWASSDTPASPGNVQTPNRLLGSFIDCPRLALAYTSWFLLALAVSVAAERRFRYRERKAWQVLAAALLSLEVLASDFAGWGAAYPAERKEAQQAFEGLHTEWLDYYMPRRSQLTADDLRRFGPSSLS